MLFKPTFSLFNKIHYIILYLLKRYLNLFNLQETNKLVDNVFNKFLRSLSC